MPGAEQYKICKCPTRGTDKGSKCPALAGGGGGGVWAQLELTDALASSKPFFTGNNSFNPKNEPSNGIEKKQVHFLQYIVHFVNPNM